MKVADTDLSLPKLNPADFRAPYLFFANGMGDHFMALPTVRALCQVFEGRLNLICQSNSDTSFLFGELNFNEVVEMEVWDETEDERRVNLGEAMNDLDIDLLINPCSWNSKDLMSFIQARPNMVSISFFEPSQYVLKGKQGEHLHAMLFRFAELFTSAHTLDEMSYPPVFKMGSVDLTALAASKKSVLGKVFLIHNETEQARQWKTEKLIQLLEKLMNHDLDFTIVILGQKLISLPETLATRVIQITTFPLPLACAFALQADYYLGVDSSFSHIVKLTDIPAIGLYGKTYGWHIGFRNPNQQNIQAPAAEVGEVSLEEVYEAVANMLDLH